MDKTLTKQQVYERLAGALDGIEKGALSDVNYAIRLLLVYFESINPTATVTTIDITRKPAYNGSELSLTLTIEA